MKDWNEIGFKTEETKDGSPSLRLLQSLRDDFDTGEAMHHSGGAATETQMIYGEAIQLTFEKLNDPLRFLVVGLGLGYIEMNIAAYSLIYNKKVGAILSYESVFELRESFHKWIHGLKLSEPIQATYDLVWGSIQKQLPSQVDTLQLKEVLKIHFPTVDSFLPAIEVGTVAPMPVDCILYDAFSSKTTPYLWEEDFLVSFLGSASKDKTILATYSAKGNLKRALKTLEYRREKRLGFKSKRGSTRAFRGF